MKKFNWGHGVVLGFTAFVGYIMYFVITSFSHDVDLVSEDYYAQEVAFQDRIEQTHNAAAYADQISVSSTAEGALLSFSPETARLFSNGTVKLFRPSDVQLDLNFPIALNETHQMLIPKQLLRNGRYEVQIQWQAGNEKYYLVKDLFI